jgi:DNA-directed RNA polymerase subunit F
MNVKHEEIKNTLENISREKADRLIENCRENPEYTEQIYRLSIQNSHPNSWRASWVLVHLNNKYPELLKNYTERMIEDLPSLKNNRQQVSFFQILRMQDYNTDDAGELFDIALNNLIAAGKQMYVQQNSLLFLEDFICRVPELASELAEVLRGENNLRNNHSIHLALKRIYKTLDDVKNTEKETN